MNEIIQNGSVEGTGGKTMRQTFMAQDQTPVIKRLYVSYVEVVSGLLHDLEDEGKALQIKHY